MRNLLVVFMGVILWVGLLSVGTFLLLRTTSIGGLLSDVDATRGDRELLSGVVVAYGDPFRLLTTTFPRLLMMLALVASVVSGSFVGAIASGRSRWVPGLIGVPLASTALLMDPSSAVVWLSTCAWGAAAGTATLLTMRWRERRAA